MNLAITFYRTFLTIAILTLSFFPPAFSQETGQINGTIIDESNGEPLIGTNILIVGTTLGASTDLDGKYLIKKIPLGTYDIRISLVGYTTKVISNTLIKENQPLTLNLSLSSEAFSVDEVIITAEAVLSTESAILTERKKSSSIGDGVSTEQIKRTPDATSAEVLKRIPSVSIVENKFLMVRGTSERYNSAMLNNTSISSGEPEKKSFAFDLFPSNLIENTMLTKSFTPDLPGDFSGGILKINTVDFPTQFMFTLNSSRGYLHSTTESSFHTYSGGSNDSWGVDDGTRSIPAGFPDNLSRGNRTPSQITSLARLFSNKWSTRYIIAPTNSNYSVSLGDRYTIFDQVLGFIFSTSYRDSYENNNIQRNEYEADGRARFLYEGAQSKYSVLWGGLANISLKLFEQHKLSFKNTFSRTSDDEVVGLGGLDNDAGSEIKQSALRFVSRTVSSTQIFGEHTIPAFTGLNLEWRLFRSISSREEPDYRRIFYAREIGSEEPYYAVIGGQVNLKNGGRYFSSLNDDTRGGGIDLSHLVGNAKFKVGGAFDEKNRNFSSRLIGVIANAAGNGFTDFYLYFLPQDSIFAPENFRQNGFSIEEYSSGFNRYTAGQKVQAAYGMVDYPLLSLNLRFIAGLRAERSLQTVNSFNLTGTIPIRIEKEYTDLLPSANIVYTPTTSSNIRFAYSQTVNRPELRELAPFAYYDFNTQLTLKGNGTLSRAIVRNYDVRLELFPGIGEVISTSFFYKAFTDAIEQVTVPGSSLGAERTFNNAERARNYGIELEIRKSLAFLGGFFSNFSINSNYSWIKSKVDFGNGTTVETRSRPLQGQSNYTINVGLLFVEPTMGTSVNILYNRFGARITEVATSYEEDVVEQPRDLLDLSVTQQMGEKFDIKFSAKDLLHQEQLFLQGDKVSRSNSRDASYSFGIGFKY